MNRSNYSLISCILVIIGVSLLFWPTPGKADFIYQYSAYAYAYADVYDYEVDNSDIKSSPPVSAQAGSGAISAFGRALSSCQIGM